MDAFPPYYETAKDIIRSHNAWLNLCVVDNWWVNDISNGWENDYHNFIYHETCPRDEKCDNEWIQGTFTRFPDGKLFNVYLPYNPNKNIYDQFFDYFADERNLWTAMEFIEFHETCPEVDVSFKTTHQHISLGTEIKKFFDHPDIVLTLDHLISEFREPTVRLILSQVFPQH
jgi:hypothetical protein